MSTGPLIGRPAASWFTYNGHWRWHCQRSCIHVPVVYNRFGSVYVYSCDLFWHWHWPLALAPGTGVTLHEPLYMYVPKVPYSPLSLSIAPLSKRQCCKLKPTLPLPLKLELRSNAQTQALALLISTSILPYLTLPYLTGRWHVPCS